MLFRLKKRYIFVNDLKQKIMALDKGEQEVSLYEAKRKFALEVDRLQNKKLAMQHAVSICNGGDIDDVITKAQKIYEWIVDWETTQNP